MPYYQKHVFVCTNQKESGKQCCALAGGEFAFDYLKSQLKKSGLFGPNKIRVSKSGCLGRCKQGPCIVIYPEGIWYRYQDQNDIDEIITQHLLKEETVSHLLITEE